MVDPLFVQGAGSAQPVSNPAGPSAPASSASDSAAFRALLDKLETQAKDLAKVSEQVEDPVEFAGAVDTAKESLADALNLRDQLFEAYRAAEQSAGFSGAEGQGS